MWVTTKDGRKINTDWFDQERQIEASKAEADERNTGVPSKMPELDDVLKKVKSLKGEELDRAINWLEWDADWYREDKRQKKGFVEAVVKNNYVRDPAEAGWGIADQIDTNRKILAAVYGVSSYGKEITEKFGTYDVDKLYLRARS